MSPSPPTPDEGKSPDQLRREAVEIIQRHRRGLPGYRGNAAPPPATAALDSSHQALLEGRQQLQAGNLAEALLRADTAIGLAPSGSDLLADGWTLRGEVCLAQNHVQAARDAFKRALGVNPAHVDARMGMAETFRCVNQHARAIPLYIETIPLMVQTEDRTRLRLLLADSYLAVGQPEAARRVLRTMEGSSTLTPAQKARAALTLLIPSNLRAWLLLLLAVTLVLVFSIGSSALAGLLAFIISLSTYAAFQWWRTPAR